MSAGGGKLAPYWLLRMPTPVPIYTLSPIPPSQGPCVSCDIVTCVRQVKIFGCVLSCGASWAVPMSKPCTTETWCAMVRTQLYPMLKRKFPERSEWTILLDGEKLMHTPMAKALYKSKGIKILPHWPAYSPDLNPQERAAIFLDRSPRGRGGPWVGGRTATRRGRGRG